jgi:hypothetical protein
LQVEKDGNVGAVVRGQSAKHQVNRLASAQTLNRFSAIAARFDPTAQGTKKIDIWVDGDPAARYSYENEEGELTAFTHDRPLEIGRQPGREPRYFKGDIAGVLLYNRTLTDEELSNRILGMAGDNKKHLRRAADKNSINNQTATRLKEEL